MDTCLLTDEGRAALAARLKSLYEQQMRPSTIYKPRLSIDGNMWCALYGENIQDGVAGFGKSPALAMQDFDVNWKEEIK